MFLVHEKAEKSGKWEVAWMWFPHFLAADRTLHKYVGERMTETFKGETFEGEVPETLLQRMHEEVIRLTLEQYPIEGLREYLEGAKFINPEETPQEG